MKRNYFTKSEYKRLVPPNESPEDYQSFLTAFQLNIINSVTPKSEIEIKEEDGFRFKTVKGSYVKKVLNLLFGWNWNFKIDSYEYFQHSREAVVQGTLSIHQKGTCITRSQFGKHKLSIETFTGTRKTVQAPRNIGNRFKSSATDSLKKCTSELGLFWDVYSQEPEPIEGQTFIPEETYDEKKITERLKHFLKQANEETFDETVESFFSEQPISEYHQSIINEYKSKLNQNEKGN